MTRGFTQIPIFGWVADRDLNSAVPSWGVQVRILSRAPRAACGQDFATGGGPMVNEPTPQSAIEACPHCPNPTECACPDTPAVCRTRACVCPPSCPCWYQDYPGCLPAWWPTWKPKKPKRNQRLRRTVLLASLRLCQDYRHHREQYILRPLTCPMTPQHMPAAGRRLGLCPMPLLLTRSAG